MTPARRGRRQAQTTDEPAPARHVSMTWAQRLKRVFKVDIKTCEHCGGAVKVIASIEDPAVINRSLTTSTGGLSPRPQTSDPSRVPRRHSHDRSSRNPADGTEPILTQGLKAGLTPGVEPFALTGLSGRDFLEESALGAIIREIPG